MGSEEAEGGKAAGIGLNAAGGGIESGGGHQEVEGEADGGGTIEEFGRGRAEAMLEFEDAAHVRCAGAGGGEASGEELGAERVIEEDAGLGWGGGGVESGEERGDRADALESEGEVIAEGAGEGADAGGEGEDLELAAAVIGEGGLEGAGHFEGGGGDTGDGEERGAVEFQDFIHLIGDDDIAGGGAAVAGHEDTAGPMEGEDGGGFGEGGGEGRIDAGEGDLLLLEEGEEITGDGGRGR